MDAKHTPGPWQVSGSRMSILTHGKWLTVGPDGAPIIAVAYGDVDDETHVRSHADARLAAAAPDLLAAAKGQHEAIDQLMVRLITLDPEFMPTKSSFWPLLVAGKEAIDKAEGSQ